MSTVATILVAKQSTPVQGVVSEHQQPRLLRLLIVTPRYFPLMGGVESHVHEVSGRLARLGAHVTLLTTDPGGQLPAYESRDGVEIHRVKAWPANRDYYFAPGILRFVQRGHWDVMHLQSYHTFVAPLAMLAAQRAHLPYVVTFHGGGHSSQLRNRLRGGQWWMLRPLLAKARRLIAVARFETELWRKRLHLPADRFVFIPNGADLPQPPRPIQTDRSLIVSIGRLERYKGHQRIIAALPGILQQRPDVRLWIAGTGPYEAELRQLAAQLRVADRVEIRAVPATERSRLAEELSRAALVMLLSDYETHPIAMLEAIALGRPVLVTDTSGLSELAYRGLATAIPLTSTPQHIASAVLDQLRTPRVPPPITLPSWDDCAAELMTVYRQVAEGVVCAS